MPVIHGDMRQKKIELICGMWCIHLALWWIITYKFNVGHIFFEGLEQIQPHSECSHASLKFSYDAIPSSSFSLSAA